VEGQQFRKGSNNPINRDEMVHNVLRTLAARLSFLLPVCADASTILVAEVAITVDEPFHHGLLKASARFVEPSLDDTTVLSWNHIKKVQRFVLIPSI
jgi:hypothetical protein